MITIEPLVTEIEVSVDLSIVEIEVTVDPSIYAINDPALDQRFSDIEDQLTNITITQPVDLDAVELGIIGNFASPNAGGYVVGRYYDNSFHAVNSVAIAGAANRAEMSPFFVSESLTIDQLGVSVSTAVAGSLLRCFIYGSNSQGWPDQLLYEGNNDLSGAAVAYVAHTLDFSFNTGIQYWLGVRYSDNTAVRGVNLNSCCNIGLSIAAGTTYVTKVSRTITFANALPQSWAFQDSDLATGVCPSIRFRKA
jgi:hypothetical protein